VNRYVRVYSEGSHADFTHRTFACVRATGRRVRLVRDQEYAVQDVGHLDAAGRWLGHSVHTSTKEFDSDVACRLDLRTGEHMCSSSGPVRDLGITPSGSLAWIAEDPLDGYHSCCGVYALRAGEQKQVQLDDGPDIDRDSLAVARHVAYWTKAGEPQSATMP
jgi:hypothetical protein